MTTTTTATTTHIGTFTLDYYLPEYSNFNEWTDFCFGDFEPGEHFENFDWDVLESFVHSIQEAGRLIIDFDGTSYFGQGMTVYHYTFSF